MPFLKQLPAIAGDPILGGAAAFDSDPAVDKIDLGIGVYRDESGCSSVLASVKRAEQLLIQQQRSKSYLSSEGAPEFNEAVQGLLFGADSAVVADGRVRTVQTPGASGALRVAAEFIRRCNVGATVWLPAPTWANHGPILQAGGLQVRQYRYYDIRSHRLTFDAMVADLAAVMPGDVVLVQGCCHNPTGADLDAKQWAELASLIDARGAVPLVDIAYQGFAEGIEQDAHCIRMMSRVLPVALIVSSCSKNFSLYRERTGTFSLVGQNRTEVERAHSHVLQLIRVMYSMPPDHGAAVVACILGEAGLRRQWSEELTAMRERVKAMRRRLADLLASAGLPDDFSHLTTQNGMFSLLDVSAAEVERLRTQFHVYLIPSGRINVAALSAASVPRVADAITAVLQARTER